MNRKLFVIFVFVIFVSVYVLTQNSPGQGQHGQGRGRGRTSDQDLTQTQEGGNRNLIFSRFHYQPDYYSFRPVYQTALNDDPITIENRQYRRFTMPPGSWFYPVYLPVSKSPVTGF